MKRAGSTSSRRYSALYPDHKLVEKKLALSDAAEIAGIKGYYDRAYRIYCQFSHAAFQVTTGNADTDCIDNPTMAACVRCGLEAVVSLGGEAPNLNAFCARLEAMEAGG